MITISLKALDIGFDLRQTGHEIDVPECIGYPSHEFVVETDAGRFEGRACDVGSKLRKAGYTVGKRWFAGRKDWGRPVVITTAAGEVAMCERAGELERRYQAATVAGVKLG